MSPVKAPGWFYEKVAEVDGDHTQPLSERELAKLCRAFDSPNTLGLRAAAEIIRLRKQLKTIMHSAPVVRGKRKPKRSK